LLRANELFMNDERRPSPEALLAELKQAGQGHLKIFLGAAPGVLHAGTRLLPGALLRAGDRCDVRL